MGEYHKMTEEQKKAAKARTKAWRENHPDLREQQLAREYERKKLRAKGIDPTTEAYPLLNKSAGRPPKPKTEKQIEYGVRHTGWRLVHQYGDLGTEIRVWIRGAVVRYEYLGSHTFAYANLFDDSGKRYKSAREAER